MAEVIKQTPTFIEGNEPKDERDTCFSGAFASAIISFEDYKVVIYQPTRPFFAFILLSQFHSNSNI